MRATYSFPPPTKSITKFPCSTEVRTPPKTAARSAQTATDESRRRRASGGRENTCRQWPLLHRTTWSANDAAQSSHDSSSTAAVISVHHPLARDRRHPPMRRLSRWRGSGYHTHRHHFCPPGAPQRHRRRKRLPTLVAIQWSVSTAASNSSGDHSATASKSFSDQSTSASGNGGGGAPHSFSTRRGSSSSRATRL